MFARETPPLGGIENALSARYDLTDDGRELWARDIIAWLRRRPSRGISSAGRALAWHARGQGFKSPILHSSESKRERKFAPFTGPHFPVLIRSPMNSMTRHDLAGFFLRLGELFPRAESGSTMSRSASSAPCGVGFVPWITSKVGSCSAMDHAGVIHASNGLVPTSATTCDAAR